MSGPPESTAFPSRSGFAGTLGALAALVVGGFWLVRRGGRRRRSGPRPPLRLSRDIVEESMNLLGAIRGYCELAKLKDENGGALECRMEATIETVDEVSRLLRQLLAATRHQAP